MQLKEAMFLRKSVKEFSNKRVDWRKILRALDYARLAPCAGNNFINKFILVDDKKKIEKLAEATQQEFVKKVDYVVIALTDEEILVKAFEDRAKRYSPLQTGAAIENFLLGLREQKLSTTWVTVFYEDQVRKEFKIPDKMIIDGIFPIGKIRKTSEPPKLKKKLENILYFGNYGNNKMVPIRKVSGDSS